MKVIYTDAHVKHQPSFEIYDGTKVAYAETAGRIDSILNELTARNMVKLIAPKHFPRHHIDSIHQNEYVEFLRKQANSVEVGATLAPSYYITDTYAPITSGTFKASIAAVDAALTGASYLLTGENVIYSLCRPPGHHAAHHSMGGYCYFNNAAVAANYLSTNGKVAILDIDYHHGNGTQEIFYERNDVLYVSLHANPAESYPYISGYANERGRGAGESYNINFPLAQNTTNQTYLKILGEAVAQVEQFAPQYLIVSAGFDTYNLDPIGGLRLTKDAYKDCGKLIGTLSIPTLVIQEGGYNTEDLGYLVANFLGGLMG